MPDNNPLQVFSGGMRFKPSLGEGQYSVDVTGHRTMRPHIKVAHKFGTIGAINVTMYADEARAYARLLLQAAEAADDDGSIPPRR